MYSLNRSGIQEYGRINTQTSIESASPHRLIQMLMEGALEKISFAKGYMQRKDIAQKSQYISHAMSIIEGLQMGLDTSVDHEVTKNLEGLYIYMNKRLLTSNFYNDIDILDEVHGLMMEIKSAWDAINDSTQC